MGKADVSISEIFRTRREKLGLTQDDLARSANIPLRTYQDIETGKSEPRFGTLRAISLALSLSSSDLWGEGKPAPRLSATAISGPISVDDWMAIYSEISNISPRQRGFLFAILFRDPSLAEDIGEPALSAALQVLQKAE